MGHQNVRITGTDPNAGPVTIQASGVLIVDATGQGDVPITMAGETLNLTEKTLTHISGQVSSSGDNEIVATPGANFRLVVVDFVIQNESNQSVLMKLRSGTDDAYRVLAQRQAEGLSRHLQPTHRWKLGENKALNLNLSAARDVGYCIAYYTEAV